MSEQEQTIGQNPELTPEETVARFMDFVTDPQRFNYGWHSHFQSAFEVTSDMRKSREVELAKAVAEGGTSLMKAVFLRRTLMKGSGNDMNVFIENGMIAEIINFEPSTYQLREVKSESPQLK